MSQENDKPGRGKKTSIPLIAKAKALLDAGNSQRFVAAEIEASKTVVQAIDCGAIQAPAPAQDQEKNTLDSRLTALMSQLIDKIKEYLGNDQTTKVRDIAPTFGIMTEKRQLLRGLPTERTDDMGRTSQEELDTALKDHPELYKQLKRLIKLPKEEEKH